MSWICNWPLSSCSLSLTALLIYYNISSLFSICCWSGWDSELTTTTLKLASVLIFKEASMLSILWPIYWLKAVHICWVDWSKGEVHKLRSCAYYIITLSTWSSGMPPKTLDYSFKNSLWKTCTISLITLWAEKLGFISYLFIRERSNKWSFKRCLWPALVLLLSFMSLGKTTRCF